MRKGFSLCGKTSQGNPCSGPVLPLYGIAVKDTSICQSVDIVMVTNDREFKVGSLDVDSSASDE